MLTTDDSPPSNRKHPSVCHSSCWLHRWCSPDWTLVAGLHLPSRQRSRLQSMNSAAQLVYSARRSEHVSPLFQELRWLHIPERIDFCLAVLVYRCINSTGPHYLAIELQRVADIESRGRLRSSLIALLHVSQDHSRPCLPRYCCESLEHATTVIAVTADFQTCIEDGTVL